MKQSYLFIIAFIVLASTNAIGQSIGAGIKLGLNSATVGDAYTNSFGPQSITTFNAGVFAKFNIAYLLALQPELLYTMKGYKLTKEAPINVTWPHVPNSNILATANISYLEIPLLIKLNIPSSSFGIIKANVFAGPDVAFKLSSKMKYEEAGQPTQEENLSNINSTDFGAIFGAGADINLPITTIMIDVRYDFGMGSSIINRVISVNAGIGI